MAINKQYLDQIAQNLSSKPKNPYFEGISSRIRGTYKPVSTANPHEQEIDSLKQKGYTLDQVNSALDQLGIPNTDGLKKYASSVYGSIPTDQFNEFLKSNPTKLGAKPKVTIGGVVGDIKDKIPFVEHRIDKSLRSDALNAYKFTPEAVEIINKSTKIKDNAPHYDPALRLTKYSDGKIAVGEPNNPFGGVTRGNSIDVRNDSSDVVGHEALHAITNKIGLFSDDTSVGRFNSLWDKTRESFGSGDNPFKKVDEILSTPPYKKNIPPEYIAKERFAYMGSALGAGGLAAIPEQFRDFYSRVFANSPQEDPHQPMADQQTPLSPGEIVPKAKPTQQTPETPEFASYNNPILNFRNSQDWIPNALGGNPNQQDVSKTIPGFKQAVESYTKEAPKIAGKITEAIASPGTTFLEEPLRKQGGVIGALAPAIALTADIIAPGPGELKRGETFFNQFDNIAKDFVKFMDSKPSFTNKVGKVDLDSFGQADDLISKLNKKGYKPNIEDQRQMQEIMKLHGSKTNI